MARYEGQKGKPDKIVGGGSYVEKHKSAFEKGIPRVPWF
jgi:hypothetical protein